MPLNHAILGLLSYRSLTGYDMKKIIQESSFMYWSGNNNQIYKALLELTEGGYVTNELHHGEKSPSKKVYSITPKGINELRRWTMSSPEVPEVKRNFFVQLAWTEQLNNQELFDLLDGCEAELKGQLSSEQERNRRGNFSPGRSERERIIWDSMYKRVADTFENELKWLETLRTQLKEADLTAHDIKEVDEKDLSNDTEDMNYRISKNSGVSFLELLVPGKPLQGVKDSLEVISLCAEKDVHFVLIPEERLSQDFFKLETGIIRDVFQKFSTYNIKVAFIIDVKRQSQLFSQMAGELNKGELFRVFKDIADGEKWLKGLEKKKK